jgi:hypothetical protein
MALAWMAFVVPWGFHGLAHEEKTRQDKTKRSTPLCEDDELGMSQDNMMNVWE